jgi:hypothetical protein
MHIVKVSFEGQGTAIAHPQDPILSQLLYNWRSAEDPAKRLFITMIEQEF